jgi:hypothetical protein
MIGFAIVIVVLPVDGIAGQLELIPFQVAHGNNLAIFLGEKIAHIAPALRPAADHAHANAVAGGNGAVLAQSRAGNDRRKGCRRKDGGGRATDEVAPGELLVYCVLKRSPKLVVIILPPAAATFGLMLTTIPINLVGGLSIFNFAIF